MKTKYAPSVSPSTVSLQRNANLTVKMLALLLLPAAALAQNQQPLYSTYDFNPLQHLAGIAPYFEPASPPRDPVPPQGCSVTRAAYLVRHAAINANSFDYETYMEPFTDKLANTSVDWSQVPELSFLSKWSPPDIEEESRLTRTGKLEAAQLGVQLSYRYPKLRLPKKVWASTAERTIASAEGFIRGIEMDDNKIELVPVYEGKESGADSLTPYKACPAYSGSTGSKQSSQYLKKFTAPIISRLQHYAPQFNWTQTDVVGMMEWCGYDAVIRGSSPFCSTKLFSPDEWLAFEYMQDIMYFYNAGYGTDIGGAFAYPWVNATMDLLNADKTEQDVFVSFTHREMLPATVVALGLFNDSALTGANNPNASMPLDHINYGRQWKSSHILPFLSNIGIEQMNCSTSFGYENATDSTYYRVLVNNSPQTLPDCYDGPLESCSAAKMQQFVQERGDVLGSFTEVCQPKYDNSTDVMSVYTQKMNGQTVGKKR